jgi:hypothetical protein
MSGKIYTEHVLIDAHPRQMTFGWTCPGCGGVYYGKLGATPTEGEWRLTVDADGSPTLDPALVCPRAYVAEETGNHRWRLTAGALEPELVAPPLPPPPR